MTLLSVTARATLAFSMLLPAYVVHALEYDTGASLGLESTDNAAKTSSNEVSDVVSTVFLGAGLQQKDGPLVLDADVSVREKSYAKGSFGDRTYLKISSTADWVISKDRFDLQIQDYFTQRTINSLEADTPANRQNINVFEIRPGIYFALSRRFSINLFPSYKRFYYEVSSADNEQTGLALNLAYQLSWLSSLGLTVDQTDTDYQSPVLADYTSKNFYLTFSTQRVRSSIQLSLGQTDIERPGGFGRSGTTGRLSWLQELSSHSSLKLTLSKDITESSNLALSAVVDSNGQVGIIGEVVGDVLDRRSQRVTYLNTGSSVDTSFWISLDELTYAQSANDREVKNVGASLSYGLTSLVRSDTRLKYGDTTDLSSGRVDKLTGISSKLSYSYTRDIKANISLSYNKKDSTQAVKSYKAFSVFANISYGYGG